MRLTIGEISHEAKEDVWYPGSENSWYVSIYGEGGRDGLQEDIGEGERKTDAEVHAHSALPFPCRQRCSDDG